MEVSQCNLAKRKNKFLLRFLIVFFISLFLAFTPEVSMGSEVNETETLPIEIVETADEEYNSPAFWSIFPFVILLLMIATGPLFYARLWHHYYPHIAAGLGTVTMVYYLFFLNEYHYPLHSAAEYFSFISLLTALFVASGGILIKVNKAGTPLVNTIILIIGAILANFIGTTGASMILIRPFIRLNRERIEAYHVVFFIFIVSNMGGSLTPIGDPPLFLGFLKGVPFFWTLEHLWVKWFFGIGLVSAIFYVLDTIKIKRKKITIVQPEVSGKSMISIRGLSSFIWLGLIIALVFVDPNVIPAVPGFEFHGEKFSFIREFLMLTIAFLAYKTCNQSCLKENEFNFAPIREVAFLFIGIFATMMPALHLISEFASGSGADLINVSSLYWLTGGLSGVLDNAPTYLNFLAAGMGKEGLDIANRSEVLIFSQQNIEELIAISISAVFFGAGTYIGNAPNFMVKSIAEGANISMPSFLGYMLRYSIPFLIPVFFLTWLVFFAFS